MLQLTDFRKRYGRQTILSLAELFIPTGVHALGGPNGSGKSTWLKILAGMIPFEGEILLEPDIRLQTDHRSHRLAVSYAEAEPLFPPYITGQYLVDLFLSLKGGHPDQLQTLKGALGITDYLTQKIATYSSGMKKKLALCLAFIGQARLILLDEPFNTLDSDAKAGLAQLITQHAQSGVNFMLATHLTEQLDQVPITHAWHIHQHQLQPISVYESR